MAAAVRIACLLGRVGSPDADVDFSSAQKNSTRWVFDVEHDTGEMPSFVFQLLDTRTGRPKDNALVSLALTPLDGSAVDACLYVMSADLPNLAITADEDAGTVRYRVAVDAVHSLMR